MVAQKFIRTAVITCFLVFCCISQAQVKTGIEVLREQNFELLRGKRVGLVTNATGVDSHLKSTIDILFEADSVGLVALFAPEHGVRGDVAAGDHVTNARDAKTQLPVYSLYGKTRKPTPEMLRGIEVLVYDIQDIGCRSYTFISTLGKVMEAACEAEIQVVVLDRPNPLGGIKIEGSGVEDGCFSFVSQYNIPYIYGLTVGELAVFVNEQIGCDLQVVQMQGWKRSMRFADTGLPWVPTSPHIPHAETALYYPATGILGELGALSIGVGYTLPFQTVAAPWINASSLADSLNALRLDGILFRPIHYKPYYGLYKGEAVHGVELHITDFNALKLTEVQFAIACKLLQLYPEQPFLRQPTATQWRMFDQVCGSKQYRQLLEQGRLSELLDAWRQIPTDFIEKSKSVWMYE
ncbi:MAG: DUF1343 domain-containing protein [Paludibacteraceae bacterium]|nr:DUF1343 domain-containing protein [Paludibacteraceae bacterium]